MFMNLKNLGHWAPQTKFCRTQKWKYSGKSAVFSFAQFY